jgi:hypothetical protein
MAGAARSRVRRLHGFAHRDRDFRCAPARARFRSADVLPADDVFTVSSEVQGYAAELAAPHVEYVPIAEASHAASFLRHELLALLQRHVRPTLLMARRQGSGR